MSTRPKMPKLPLTTGAFALLDADGRLVTPRGLDALNRAAERYGPQRRALRHARAELEQTFGPPSAQNEEEASLLQEIREALGAREGKR